MTIVDKIDSILKERNMSRRQLAKLAGIPTSSLQSAMERGKNISVDMLYKIADALNVPIVSLLDEINLKKEDIEPYIVEIETPFGTIGVDISDSGAYETAIIDKYKNLVGETNEESYKKTPKSKEKVVAVIDPSNFKRTLEVKLIDQFQKLNSKGQEIAIERIEELTKIPDYQKDKGESPNQNQEGTDESSPGEDETS